MTTLSYALLTLLAREPSSGYDLLQLMKNPIGFFWHAHQSQLYPELARLESQGYVSSRVMEQQHRPDKRIYTITEAGRAALQRWVTQPPASAPERNELLLKTYAIWLADPTQAIRLFQIEEDHHRSRLAQYEQILAQVEQKYGPNVPLDIPHFGDYATLRKGIGYEREYVNWCRWMIEQFEASATQKEEEHA